MTPTKAYLEREVARLQHMLDKRTARVADAKTKLAEAKRRLAAHGKRKAAT